MNLIPILAAVSGEGLIHNLKYIIIIGACILILWAVGNWLMGIFSAPEIVKKGWMVLFVVLGAFAFINFLLTLIDSPLVKW